MTAALTQSLVDNGTRAARQFFDEELRHVRSARSNTSVCYGTEELYTHVTDGLDISLERIVIAEDNTNWVYPLFPSLLTWVMKGVRLQVLLPEHGDNPRHGPYRRRLLGALGVDIKEIRGASSVPVRTYILDSKDPAQIKAVVGIERGSAHGIEAVVYTGVLDSPVIRSVLLQVEQHLDTDLASPTPPSIISGGQDQLLKYLSGVGQYAKSGVDLTLENVALDRMVSLTRFVREYKYKQIHHLIALYRRHEIPLFSSAAVRFHDGKQSLLTPPVVEQSGDKFVLVEGSTRAIYCRDTGSYKDIKCVVVRGVQDPLPSETILFSQVRVVGRTLETSERYDGFDYDNFRHIENSVHPLNSLD